MILVSQFLWSCPLLHLLRIAWGGKSYTIKWYMNCIPMHAAYYYKGWLGSQPDSPHGSEAFRWVTPSLKLWEIVLAWFYPLILLDSLLVIGYIAGFAIPGVVERWERMKNPQGCRIVAHYPTSSPAPSWITSDWVTSILLLLPFGFLLTSGWYLGHHHASL